MEPTTGRPRPCPVDGSELTSRTHLEVSYLACRRCGGLWLGRDELTRLELRTPKGTRPPATPVTEAPGPPHGPRRCVCTDRPQMAQVDRYGVTLDVCSSCGGLWLDAGEIERILQCYEEPGIDHGRPAAYQPSARYPSAGEVAGDLVAGVSVVDLGLEALGGLFDFLTGSWA